MKRIEWIFYGAAVVFGAAAAALYIYVPASRTYAVSPYFWLLVAMALLETVVMYLRGFEFGPPVTLTQRIIGFAIAAGLFLLLRTSAGVA